MFPQAYHLIWGTHGTRLHGSAKPHVDRDHNVYGPRSHQPTRSAKTRHATE